MRRSDIALEPRSPEKVGRSGGLFVGRLDADRGVETLAEALAIFPGARIDIAGVGPEEMRLAAFPNVRLLGQGAPGPMRDHMRRAAYLVLPALDYEPLPRPLVRAFATGLAVIASRVPALAGVVEPGRNGLLFEPGSARDLAKRLAWAEAFPEKMRQMGECAKADYRARLVSDFSYPRLFGERRRAARP